MKLNVIIKQNIKLISLFVLFFPKIALSAFDRQFEIPEGHFFLALGLPTAFKRDYLNYFCKQKDFDQAVSMQRLTSRDSRVSLYFVKCTSLHPHEVEQEDLQKNENLWISFYLSLSRPRQERLNSYLLSERKKERHWGYRVLTRYCSDSLANSDVSPAILGKVLVEVGDHQLDRGQVKDLCEAYQLFLSMFNINRVAGRPLDARLLEQQLDTLHFLMRISRLLAETPSISTENRASARADYDMWSQCYCLEMQRFQGTSFLRLPGL